MPKLSEILGESYSQIPEELQTKYKDIDLVDSSTYVAKDKFDTLNEQLKSANITIADLKKNNKDVSGKMFKENLEQARQLMQATGIKPYI